MQQKAVCIAVMLLALVATSVTAHAPGNIAQQSLATISSFACVRAAIEGV